MRGFALILPLLGSCGAAPDGGVDPRAQQVFDRSKSTDSTYASYTWNWVRNDDGKPAHGWSAEFHRDHLHRVETPTVRIVADCAAGTGTFLDVKSNEKLRGPRVAAAACGIQSNSRVLEMQWLGESDSRFGRVDMIKVVDPEEDRFYAVNDDGVLVAAEIFPRADSALYCVQNQPLAVERDLPADDIFTEESLSRSVVASRFRSPAEKEEADLWRSARRCR